MDDTDVPAIIGVAFALLMLIIGAIYQSRVITMSGTGYAVTFSIILWLNIMDKEVGRT